MIKFFRKIRRQLLVENMTGRYLKYAIGEIILVVIGILIALQINNWNESRKDRVLEKELLIDLKLTLESNIAILGGRTKYFNRGQKSSKIIINVLDAHLPDHDSLGFHFYCATNGYGGADLISYVGFEALRNNGFNLIKNKSLKDAVLQLFETTYRDLISFDETFVKYNPYYKEVLGTLFYQDKVLSLKPYDFNSIIKSPGYYAILTDYHFNCGWMKEETNKGLSETQSVLQLIKDELNESE